LAKWSKLATILATLAGVVGAAAAVYPLVVSPVQHVAHLIPDLNDPDLVHVQTFTDPVVFTGNWSLRRSWKRTSNREMAEAVGRGIGWGFHDLKDIRISADHKSYFEIDRKQIAKWLNGSIGHCSSGEFEIKVEFKSRGGSTWETTTLPWCLGAPL
jgi:hypothetical protein